MWSRQCIWFNGTTWRDTFGSFVTRVLKHLWFSFQWYINLVTKRLSSPPMSVLRELENLGKEMVSGSLMTVLLARAMGANGQGEEAVQKLEAVAQRGAGSVCSRDIGLFHSWGCLSHHITENVAKYCSWILSRGRGCQAKDFVCGLCFVR